MTKGNLHQKFTYQDFCAALNSLLKCILASSCEKGTYHSGKGQMLSCAISPEPLLFAHMMYGTRGGFRQSVRDLALWMAAYAHLKDHKTHNVKFPLLVRRLILKSMPCL